METGHRTTIVCCGQLQPCGGRLRHRRPRCLGGRVRLGVRPYSWPFLAVEPRRAARDFLLGLLSDVESRSCWQLAEQAGHGSPSRMQGLLADAVWDADDVRDHLCRYVIVELGDPGGVLILDDTGDLKRGEHSVGVQRQYTGTAGRIENAQVSTFLGYASRHGRVLIDREVYLPNRGPMTGIGAGPRACPTRSASPRKSRTGGE